MAASRGSLPNSYWFPDLFMIYLFIAADSVIFKSPSIKYGKFGKDKANFFLSPLYQASFSKYLFYIQFALV